MGYFEPDGENAESIVFATLFSLFRSVENRMNRRLTRIRCGFVHRGISVHRQVV